MKTQIQHRGYLVFTTHDGDELDATLITDKIFFKKLKMCQSNDEAIQLWDKWCQKNNNPKRWYVMTLGRTITKWSFNNIKILDTYYFQVY
jgi:hypothetical protein